MGQIQFDTGDYEAAVETLTESIKINPNRSEAYLYRFLSNVELGDGKAADIDRENVLNAYPELFEANLGLVRTHYLNERYGSASLAVEDMLPLASTDEEKALAYYWTAKTYAAREETAADAAEYWELLLDLPEDAMTEEMRAEAEEGLVNNITATPSRTPTITRTPTVTRTPTPTRTPTKTVNLKKRLRNSVAFCCSHLYFYQMLMLNICQHKQT